MSEEETEASEESMEVSEEVEIMDELEDLGGPSSLSV
jgi:hypothetical protein